MTITVTADYGELAHEYTPIWSYGKPGRREHGKWSTVYTVDGAAIILGINVPTTMIFYPGLRAKLGARKATKSIMTA